MIIYLSFHHFSSIFRVKSAVPAWVNNLVFTKYLLTNELHNCELVGRFWKSIFVRLTWQGDSPVVQLFHAAGDKEPFQELPLQACYSVSEIGAQQYDQYGKIFTVKLQYVFYKERPGVR